MGSLHSAESALFFQFLGVAKAATVTSSASDGTFADTNATNRLANSGSYCRFNFALWT
jgi:hypothetical protein